MEKDWREGKTEKSKTLFELKDYIRGNFFVELARARASDPLKEEEDA